MRRVSVAAALLVEGGGRRDVRHCGRFYPSVAQERSCRAPRAPSSSKATQQVSEGPPDEPVVRRQLNRQARGHTNAQMLFNVYGFRTKGADKSPEAAKARAILCKNRPWEPGRTDFIRKDWR